MRQAKIERVTQETDVSLEIGLDGPPAGEIDSGLPFLDHMLAQLVRHGRFLLNVKAAGDLQVDVHHLVEDVGITLGMAFKKALASHVGIERYGSAFAPMDETLVHLVLDVSGRPYLAFAPEDLQVIGEAGGVNVYHLREFLRGFTNHAGVTMHLRVLAGREAHHVIEASFKALARALYAATRITREDLPSSKGII